MASGKTVTTGFLEGIKEARQEKRLLEKTHPAMTPADWKARFKSNVETGEKILSRLEPGSFNAEFVRGQIGFWQNQSKVLTKNPRRKWKYAKLPPIAKSRARGRALAKSLGLKKNPRGGDHISLKELREHARGYGMTVRLADGEYRVAFPKDEAGAYYTNDAQDALGTMKDMYRRSQGIIMATKNPKFGRKRARKAPAKKRTGSRRMSPKLTARVQSVAASLPDRYVIRGKANGKFYFYNGRGFDSVGAHAAYYIDPDMARKIVRAIRGMLPQQLKALEVARV